jgi:cephalosporin-C deacetylase
MESALPPYDSNTPANRCQPYFDPMNFAPDIHCPMLMNAGLIDPVSPPSSVWAAYNRLGTKQKQMVALPGVAHDWSAAFDRYAWEWLSKLKRNETLSTSAFTIAPSRRP